MHHRERKLIIRKRIWLQTFFFQQFHVLFNFFFKMLFIFRSFYLCAIDLWSIFSFKWNISFILNCILKQLDSSKKFHMKSIVDRVRDFHSLWRFVLKNLNRRFVRNILYKLLFEFRKSQISNLSCCRFTRRYWSNFCWFLFFRLLICLSSTSISIWFEINHWKMSNCLIDTQREICKTKCQNFVTFQISLNRHEIANTSRKRNSISNNVWKLQWRSNKHAFRNIKKRNVRSKIRWFTKFCNSHYLSHFVAFFIDVKIKRFVVESFDFYKFTRTTLIADFAWIFDELKSVNFSKQARDSSKQHRYVNTNEKLKSIRFRLSIMIFSQISRFTSFQNWNAIDHISISIHESSLCDLWIAIVLKSRLQTIKNFRFFFQQLSDDVNKKLTNYYLKSLEYR